MKDRIAKSVFWVVWSKGGGQILSFISTLLVARLLDPKDYGLMAMATVWVFTLLMVVEMGLGGAIIQFRDLTTEELNACFWLSTGIGGGAYVALYAIAPVIADWLQNKAMVDVLRVMGLLLPLHALRLVPDSLLKKRLHLDRFSKAEIVGVLSAIPLTLSLAWFGWGVWALAAGALATPCIQACLSYRFAAWRPGFRTASERLRPIIRYSVGRLGGNICWAFYNQTDSLVLGKIAGETALGFFSVAKQFASYGTSKVTSAVVQVSAPVLAELQNDRDALAEMLYRSVRLTACIVIPLCLGGALVADDLIAVVLTKKWLPSAPVFQLLCLWSMIQAADVLLPPVLMARYRARFLFAYNFLLLLVMPVAFWFGAIYWGGFGVALAWVCVYPLVIVFMAREVLLEIRAHWKQLFLQIASPTAAAICMVLGVVVIRNAIAPWFGLDEYGRLTLSCMVGGLIYIGGLLLYGGPLVDEIRNVVSCIIYGYRATPSLNTSSR